jgi:hypothetical protein
VFWAQYLAGLNYRAWAKILLTTNPLETSSNPIIKIKKVGVKFPGFGIPLAVDGWEVLLIDVGVIVGVFVIDGVKIALVVGVGVIFLVGVGVVFVPEGVAVKAGRVFSPAAKTVKVLVTVLPP